MIACCRAFAILLYLNNCPDRLIGTQANIVKGDSSPPKSAEGSALVNFSLESISSQRKIERTPPTHHQSSAFPDLPSTSNDSRHIQILCLFWRPKGGNKKRLGYQHFWPLLFVVVVVVVVVVVSIFALTNMSCQ